MKTFIIRNFEQELSIPQLKWLLVETLTYLLLSVYFISTVDVDNISTYLFPILFFVSLVLRTFSGQYLSGIFYYFHPKKQEIKEEVQAFIAMQRELREGELREVHNFQEKKYYPDYEELEEWVEKNLPEGRAFGQLAHKFFLKMEDSYEKSFYVWVNIVPWRRLDYSKALEILKNIKLKPFTENKKFVDIDVEELFADYSEKDIRRVFSGQFDGDFYWKLLNKYEAKARFPVVHHMSDLIFYLDELGAVQFAEPACDLSDEGIRRIKHSAELIRYAREFRNCAKGYMKSLVSGKYTMYVVGGERKVMFHVNKKGNVIEMKYPLNEVLSKKDAHMVLDHVKRKFSVKED